MYSRNKVYITPKTTTEVTDNIFSKNNSDKKFHVHNACAKQKRCYDVTLSRQEGNMSECTVGPACLWVHNKHI